MNYSNYQRPCSSSPYPPYSQSQTSRQPYSRLQQSERSSLISGSRVQENGQNQNREVNSNEYFQGIEQRQIPAFRSYAPFPGTDDAPANLTSYRQPQQFQYFGQSQQYQSDGQPQPYQSYGRLQESQNYEDNRFEEALDRGPIIREPLPQHILINPFYAMDSVMKDVYWCNQFAGFGHYPQMELQFNFVRAPVLYQSQEPENYYYKQLLRRAQTHN